MEYQGLNTALYVIRTRYGSQTGHAVMISVRT